MQLQHSQDDPSISIQNRYLRSPKLDHNPMDICAMLNPPDKLPTTAGDHPMIEEETRQILIDAPISNQTEQNLQLLSISSRPVHSQYQWRSSYQLPRESPHFHPRPHDRSFNLYSLQDLNPDSEYPVNCYTTHNNSYPTSPPSLASSPTHRDRKSFWNGQHPHAYSPYPKPHPHQGKIVVNSNPNHLNSPTLQVQAANPHPHSNRPYTTEQVHFLRYHREDCGGLSWPQILKLFLQQFPEYDNLQWPLTVPCLSSRYYRANKVPMLDDDGELIFDNNGKVIMIPVKVRGRNTGEGKSIPYTFVDMHPDFALLYDWVKPEDKTEAMRILQGLEEVELDRAKITKWQRHQRSLRKVDRNSPELVLAQKTGMLHVSSKL